MTAMAEEICARDEHGLRHVVDRVHDLWLDLEQVHFDEATGLLIVGILDEACYREARSAHHSNSTASFTMTFARVKSLHIQDTERIRFYDVDSIQYEPGVGVVTISTGIPLGFQIRVSDLDLTLRRIGSL